MLINPNALFAIGILLNFFMAFLALEKAVRYGEKARIYLSIFLIINAFYFLSTNILQIEPAVLKAPARWVKIPLVLAMVPAFYLFVQQLISQSRPGIRYRMIHFLPSILILVLNLPVLWISAEGNQAAPDAMANIINYWVNLINRHVVFVVIFLQLVVYAVRLLVRYPRYVALFETWYSSASLRHQTRFRWLLITFIGFYLLLDTYLVGLIIDLSRYQIIYTAILVFLVPVIGWLGLSVQMLPMASVEMVTDQPSPPLSENAPPPSSDDRGQPALSSDLKASLHHRLNQYLTEQEPFCNPQLSLAELAQSLGTNTKYLSATINEYAGCNFYTLINGHRIEKVKQLMADPKYNGYSYLGLAQTAGFNSKSAFIAAFKRHTGMTPSAYVMLLNNGVG